MTNNKKSPGTYNSTIEKIQNLGKKVNIVICQNSKIKDWIEYFKAHYNFTEPIFVSNLNNKEEYIDFFQEFPFGGSVFEPEHIPKVIGVIDYKLAFKRQELLKLHNFALILDKISLTQNEQTKLSKFILKLDASNIIFLNNTSNDVKI